ncbi:MAG: hypothetical protein ACTSPX_04985 [Candidatus Thorarchaeota archaeon]
MKRMICSAMEEKKILRFYYKGGIRAVEPFCCGMGKAGNELLRGYQVGGYSESGGPVGWSLFRLSDMSSLTITDDTFTGMRPNYNPDDSAMEAIYCSV